jgi:prepilin-type N-terminal cleavage/methylation domain-containing protein
MDVSIKAKGFTLLELMLVIVLLTTLTIAGLAMYQIQLKNFKVDKTALQMQQWLEAGLAFYVDCHQWPDPSVDPDIMNKMMGKTALTAEDCQNPVYQNQIRQYMPPGSNENGPWLNKYEIVVPDSVPDKPSFYIKTNLGKYSDALFNVGKMIAARLPFGETSSVLDNDVIVQASVGRPSSGIIDNSRGFILSMQTVDSSSVTKVKVPLTTDCPPGMVPDVEVAPVTFSPPRVNNTNVVETSYGYQSGVENIIATVQTSTLVTPPFGPSYSEYNKSGRVLLITACLPKGSTEALSNKTNVSAVSRY